jgi:hypothetical protein
MKVIIISDNPNHPGQHKLVESLRRHGWDYVEIVEPFRGLGYKISELAKYLRQSGDKEFILMDAFDTYCIAPPSEWKHFADHVVVSGEKQCFPHPEKADFFWPGRSPWKFPNSGQIWGRSQELIDLVETFPWNDADNDQIWYTDRAAGKSVSIDDKCMNFQSIAFEEEGDFSFVYDRLQNNVTGTMPLFIHGNGRTDMTKFYERL